MKKQVSKPAPKAPAKVKNTLTTRRAPSPPPMAARGFCQHGKVWTTCQICGKEVIAAAAKRGGARMDEFAPFPKPKKKVEEETTAEEAPEEPAESES
jgi:hypothetical protein